MLSALRKQRHRKKKLSVLPDNTRDRCHDRLRSFLKRKEVLWKY